jgi:hypothetical protein
VTVALLMVYTVSVRDALGGVALATVAGLDTDTGRAAAERAAIERSGMWDPAQVAEGRVQTEVLSARPYDARRDAHLLAPHVSARNKRR